MPPMPNLSQLPTEPRTLATNWITRDNNSLFKAFANAHCGQPERHLEYRIATASYLSTTPIQWWLINEVSDPAAWLKNKLDLLGQDNHPTQPDHLHGLCKVYKTAVVLIDTEDRHHITWQEFGSTRDGPCLALALNQGHYENILVYDELFEGLERRG